MIKGQIVKSKAGRDKDRFFVVLETDGEMVKIADGKLRKVEAPKTKKMKHLAKTNTVLELPELLTNKKLKELISNYQQTKEV